jgi:hypothetical protein
MLGRSLLNYAALPQVPPPPRPAAPFDVSIQDTPPNLKISVEEDGVYQVTQAQIQGAGFDLAGVDPHFLRLLNQGNQVAIYVDGEEDGIFDSGDWLEFYGTAPDSIYTRRNVYSANPSPTSGNNVWEIPSLPAPGSGTIAVTVWVPEDVPTGITLANQASLSGDDIDTESDVAHTFVGYLITLPIIFK